MSVSGCGQILGMVSVGVAGGVSYEWVWSV